MAVRAPWNVRLRRYTRSGLRPDGARRLLADGDLPGVGNVFDRVADDVQAGVGPDGDTGELVLRLNFRT